MAMQGYGSPSPGRLTSVPAGKPKAVGLIAAAIKKPVVATMKAAKPKTYRKGK